MEQLIDSGENGDTKVITGFNTTFLELQVERKTEEII